MPRFVADTLQPPVSVALSAMRRNASAREQDNLAACLAAVTMAEPDRIAVERTAAAWVANVRSSIGRTPGLESFLAVFSLSNREGIALMCLAEALLRIPDAATADALIRDTIGGGDWKRHLGQPESVFVNAATWALMLTGSFVRETDDAYWLTSIKSLAQRAGDPVV
ncbi:MAG: trifunctional transcriptional regulator/proline dehydrogenase/L-glutamate gamma-semialdehyde dehydrogenase, partial [Alphaproteobacteria bacterium]|nr:trifunctional transcriptional regulator/proline dehydrogenase/L-glutamate gamma-semialdehyde dehydrogenase [Alphaproteobacteria bacterium]